MCVGIPVFKSYEEGEKYFRRWYGYFDAGMERYLVLSFPAPVVEIKKELPVEEKKPELVEA